MMFRILAVLTLLIAWSTPVSTAQEPARLALLIGNKGYTAKVGQLKNPHNDVDLVAAALTKVGFKVTVLKDATCKQMDTALKRYVSDVRRAGNGALSFFYYSGHGVSNPETQINYLIPVDVADADDDKVWFESFQQNAVIDLLAKQASAATHYLVFDACRNELNVSGANAKALGSDKGFVPVADTSGLQIAYATAPKRTASDVGDGGGPYAKVLAGEIGKPNVEAVTMFRSVHLKVKSAIGQDPWLSIPTLPEVYLGGKVETPAPPTLQPPLSEAAQAWVLAKDTTDPTILDAFIRRFGDTFYGDLAKARLQQVRPPTAAASSFQPPPAPKIALQAPSTEPSAAKRSAEPSDPVAALVPGSGQSAKDCAECPEVVAVPAGRFTMGSPSNEIPDFPNEKPQHEVLIPRPFAIGRFEVTVGEFRSYLAANPTVKRSTECFLQLEAKALDPKAGTKLPGIPQGDDHPVVCVSWAEAKAYASWLSRKTGKSYRLLSEAEWEYAARGGPSALGKRHWWGETTSHDFSNYGRDPCCAPLSEGRDQWMFTAPVGSFPKNPFGLNDMNGNVMEWVEDCYHDSYAAKPAAVSATGAPWVTPGCKKRVIRGGSWYNGPWNQRSADRGLGTAPEDRDNDLGFRVARTL